MKTVSIMAHAFDCLAAHVTITGRGTGGNIRTATARAVQSVLKDPRLSRKQIGDFKMTVVVIGDKDRKSQGRLAIDP
jgi:hypothetical protein